MKLAARFFILFAVSLLIYNYSINKSSSEGLTEINQPEFTDNGKTVDSLKKVFNCDSIDYENWSDKKASDSCLTVCLINSTKFPKWDNVDEEVNQFRAMALAIKNSLAKPQHYNAFYLIFIKKENVNGQEIKVHSAGMEISSVAL